MNRRWTTVDSEELYNLPGWGLGLFRAGQNGHLHVHAQGRSIDLREVVDDLVKRGIELPILVRLTDVLKDRVEALAGAFREAIAEHEYNGAYRGVYPIKVNQQRQLVDELVQFSRPHHLGLECGSKPELMVVLARMDDPEALIICNGYKDAEYIEMALLSRKLGRNTIIVVEQFEELPVILDLCESLEVEPCIGLRAKLGTQGSGKWKDSSGDMAKFGLSMPEILKAVKLLKQREALGAVRLLHFHIGSQVSNIRTFRQAIKEGARVYVELVRLGAPMGYLDCGGGLGVDYDGSHTQFHSSMNYELHEYAHAVVRTIQDVCDELEVPHPTIVTETGRALVAHSSVLVVPVVNVNRPEDVVELDHPEEPGDLESLDRFKELMDTVTRRNVNEVFHEAAALKDEVATRFSLGLATLEERAAADSWFYAVCRRVVSLAGTDLEIHEDLQPLARYLADVYFCNFSLFQSMPDSWAIKQLFPVVPLQRLNEEPRRRAVLVDLTCDSDGKIDKFIDRRDVKDVLELHDLNPGEAYYLGFFLVGAYQEILGDLHNLFGDTNAVHVQAAENERGYRLSAYVEGDRVEEVLRYVQYTKAGLVDALRASVEEAYERGTISVEEGRRLMRTYLRQLDGYTYLG